MLNLTSFRILKFCTLIFTYVDLSLLNCSYFMLIILSISSHLPTTSDLTLSRIEDHIHLHAEQPHNLDELLHFLAVVEPAAPAPAAASDVANGSGPVALQSKVGDARFDDSVYAQWLLA